MTVRVSLGDRILESPILRSLVGLLSALVTGGIFFLAAGRWDLPMGWAVTAVVAAMSLYGTLAVDPDLIRERSRPGPGAQDQVMIHLAKLLGASALVLAGLDVGRFGWTGPLPPGLQWFGLVTFAGPRFTFTRTSGLICTANSTPGSTMA